MKIEKLIEKLRTESLYKDKATLEIMDLCMDAALALEQLRDENEKLKAQVPRWIPVEERLPEENVTVLAFNADPHAEKYVLARYRTVVYLGCYWCQFDQEYDSWCASCWKVTHWMPLPPGPSAKGEK